jgi:predicted Zn-dependent protease
MALDDTALNAQVLGLIRRGNTLAGLQRLLAVPPDELAGAAALNRALYALPSPAHQMRVAQEKARLLTLIAQGGEQAQPGWLFNLGCIALYEDEILNAHYYVSEVLRLAPDHLAAQHNLAYTLELMADVEEARTQYERVLTADPQFLLSQVNLALLDLFANQADAGIRALEALYAAHPDNQGLLLYLCRARLTRRAPGDAQAVMALLDGGDSLKAFQDLAECRAFACYLAEDYAAAEQALQGLLAQEPRSLFAVTGMLKVAFARQDRSTLRQYAQRYQALNPDETAQALLAALADADAAA